MNNSANNAAILLVEDHRDLAETILDYLEHRGFITDYASDGAQALELCGNNNYDAIILDISIPKLDGFEVCEQLRNKARINTPVIMLTARDQLDDKLTGFQAGADDYIVKPCELPELEARLLAAIRRNRGILDLNIMQVHDLILNTRTLQVTRADKPVKLSPTCLRILKILLRESPNVVTREALERELWGDLVPDSDTLRSHLYNLRKAIDKPFSESVLHTMPGLGFKICPPE